MDNPAEVLNTVGVAVAIFEELQKQDSLWELLLDLPNLFLLSTDGEKLAAGARRLEFLKRWIALASCERGWKLGRDGEGDG